MYINDLVEFKEWTTQTTQEWILIGAHWGICTHKKPLGFNNLLGLVNNSNLSVFSYAAGTLKWHNDEQTLVEIVDERDYQNDELNWEVEQPGLYRLVP